MFISILQEPKGGLSKQKTKTTTYKQPNKKNNKTQQKPNKKQQ